MVLFSISMMFPIAAVGTTIMLYWMSGELSGNPTKPDIFRNYIQNYMIAKTGLSLFCALLSFLVIDDK